MNRGQTVLLTALARESGFAFALAKDLGRERSSVTDALHRLETMGLARATWETAKIQRGSPRRVYTLTAKGRREHAKIADPA